LPGWKESTVGIKDYEKLPPNARHYLERVQALVGVPITIISTGPDRDQTIIRENPFG
jgi:adenylosuccinate synthase